MIKERGDEYDLVVAAMEMQGMDCFTFLRTIKTLSKIPVVLITSNELDNQLAIKTIKHGACQYFEKPLIRYDVRSLWQHVFSKGKKKTANDVRKNEENELHQSDNTDQLIIGDSKGKGIEKEFPEKNLSIADGSAGSKQNEQEMQKRKRSDDDVEEETGQTGIDDTKCSAEAVQRKNMKSDNNPAKWDADLRTKLTNTLTKEKGKAIRATTQLDIGTTDVMSDQHSKTTGHPNPETVPNASYAFGNKIQSVPKFNTVSGAEKEQHGTRSLHIHPGSQSLGAPKLNLRSKIQSVPKFNSVSGAEKERHGARSPSFQPGSQFLGTQKLNRRNKTRSAPKFKSASVAGKEQHGTWSPSFHPGSQLLGTLKQNAGNTIQNIPNFETVNVADKEPGTGKGSQFLGTPKLNLRKNIGKIGTMNGKSYKNNSLLLNNNNQMAVNEITNNQPNLKGRIDQIRHAYRTNTQSGTGTFIANYGYHGSSSSDLGYYSPSSTCPPRQAQSSGNYVQPTLQNSYNLQTETTGCSQTENLPYSDTNHNSMYPSDSLANQAIQPINNLGEENFGVMYTSEGNLSNADASNAQQPTEDDLLFEEILAELQDDFANNDLRSLGFSNITNL